MKTPLSLRLLLSLACLISCLGGCASLPSLAHRSISTAATDTDTTPLGKAIVPQVRAHAPDSGIVTLANGLDAFAARAHLAQRAERTLDIQYYIWHDDLTGRLLFDAVRAAADRGVRVRLLLDDLGTGDLDPALTALDAHPNVEVRLFNPFPDRRLRWVDFITDFSRLNRRMHNKSFTADNQATIVGGRNIGDEYFGAGGAALFVDLDVLAVGPVVNQVSIQFDRYWASASAYPLRDIAGAGSAPHNAPYSAGELGNDGTSGDGADTSDQARAPYLAAIRNSGFVHHLLDHTLDVEWAPAQVLADDPRKGLGQAPQEDLLATKLRPIVRDSDRAFDLVSAYFVPTKAGERTFSTMAEAGVRIRVVTNSLAATDVPIVNAGYSKHRKPLLAAGVRLYELRRDAAAENLPARAGWFAPGRRTSGSAAEHAYPYSGSFIRSGGSGASLHAKTFTVDGARVFVGSFNFDQRSARLNTEMGVVVDSPPLARRVSAAIDRNLVQNAYEVHLSTSGTLYWTEQRDGAVIRYDSEPGTTLLQRARVYFLSLLPLDWLL